MSFVIPPNPYEGDPCQLQFHQFMIYDAVNWTQDGYLCWDATAKQFYVQPFPEQVTNNTPVGNVRGLRKK